MCGECVVFRVNDSKIPLDFLWNAIVKTEFCSLIANFDEIVTEDRVEYKK